MPKGCTGVNVVTAVSYFKGVLMLLYNYDAILTDTMGLSNDIITLADCNNFTEYIKHILCFKA